jgi:hypothetical protein
MLLPLGGLPGVGAELPASRAWRWPTPSRSRAGPPCAAAAGGHRVDLQAATYRPLFEDHRARLVGDTLTVQIVEKVTASAEVHQHGRQERQRRGRHHRAAAGKSLTRPARQRHRHRQQHLRRQGHHREQQRLHRHHHRGRARGAAQRPPAGGRREADRRQQQRRRAALLGPGRPAHHPAGNTVPSTRSPTCGSSSAAAARRPTPR